MDQRLRPSKLVPSGFKVDRMTIVGTDVVITIRHQSPVGICSSCGRASPRVHSRYSRRVADLPLSGRRVRLIVAARRFRCDAVLCRRRIFAERFGDAVPSLSTDYLLCTLFANVNNCLLSIATIIFISLSSHLSYASAVQYSIKFNFAQ